MTLTPEQKETERVKFEEAHKHFGGFLNRDEHGIYITPQMQSRWSGWLACRESNNEISLPKMVMLQKPPNGKYVGAFYESELKSIIESQCYTVKSQG